MKLWKVLLLSAAILMVAGMATAQEESGGDLMSGKQMAAAIAISVSAIGAGYAVGVAGSASAGAVAEKPDLFGRVLVFVAFGEAIAIYGLLVALMILLGIGG